MKVIMWLNVGNANVFMHTNKKNSHGRVLLLEKLRIAQNVVLITLIHKQGLIHN